MPRPESAKEGSGRKRFPWLTKEDMTILAVLDSVDPAAADRMERLIRQQANADAIFYEQVKLECDLGADGTAPHLEHVHGLRQARWTVGAGGGHHRHRSDDVAH
jgi:hypothetical protein